ncbi:MAG: histidine triad nucleotide-binding protein [Planctomycetota bacterium]
MPTLFEKLIAGEIPADFVHEDEHCVAFKDVAPQAPVHLLVVPREPIESLAAAEDRHKPLLGHLLRVVDKVASDAGLTDGYRVAINTGEGGGQTVPHLHLHVLGGRGMSWPPG